MAAPIIPILKKLAVAVLTDKKLFKKVLGILLGVIIVIIMPILAILGIFSGVINIDTGRIQELLTEYETTITTTCTEIETEMLDLGYSELKAEEAQILYVFALYDYGVEEGFIEKLVGCYTIKEQN